MKTATPDKPPAYTSTKDRERDLKILERVRQGDQESFGMLVRYYEQPLYNFMVRHRLDQETAADLTQEAFLKSFRSLSSFKAEKSSFKTWLYTIAFNLIRDNARRNKVRSRGAETLAREQEIRAPARDIAEGLAAQDQVERLLGHVDEETRTLLVLRFLQDVPYAEISQVTGLNPATVRSKVHRGLRKIQTFLHPGERRPAS
jgi:RNA polymerase sigma-70 factor (ECF subfamily)